MDSDEGGNAQDPGPSSRRFALLLLVVLVAALAAINPTGAQELQGKLSVSWTDYVPTEILLAVTALVVASAFFSGSETAFFSIQRHRLRGMREEGSLAERCVAKMMEHPGRLLATVLVGNMIVNVLIGILLGTRVEDYFNAVLESEALAYVCAVAVCTSVLLFFGEITPKVFAVRTHEAFARAAVFPLMAADRVLGVFRDGLLRITDLLFRITRFHELRAAPFMTDDEFKAALSDSEAHGVIEKDEREMIQGILEFSDVLLSEVLTPRPDVVALAQDATVREALSALGEHDFSRMPVYEDDMDHVVGILVAKDLLPCFAKGELERPIRGLVRPPHFVPATLTVQQFVKAAQRRRTHLAIVVDEYGGTEGIVTLEDAIEQVVGDIMDEGEQEEPDYVAIGDGAYRVKGNLPLDELNELLGVSIEDEEHETVAGFFMNQTDRVPEPGDEIQHSGLRFSVETCSGKRAETVRIQPVGRGEKQPPEEGA